MLKLFDPNMNDPKILIIEIKRLKDIVFFINRLYTVNIKYLAYHKLISIIEPH